MHNSLHIVAVFGALFMWGFHSHSLSIHFGFLVIISNNHDHHRPHQRRCRRCHCHCRAEWKREEWNELCITTFSPLCKETFHCWMDMRAYYYWPHTQAESGEFFFERAIFVVVGRKEGRKTQWLTENHYCLYCTHSKKNIWTDVVNVYHYYYTQHTGNIAMW